MSPDLDTDLLARQLVRALGSGCSEPLLQKLSLGLAELLIGGQPVSVGQLADHLGQTETAVRNALPRLPDLEIEDGRLVGGGITLRPTRHRFTVDGRTLFTWCAWDTLTFPPLLDRTAAVESACPATGEAVRLVVSPTEVQELAPGDAVISLVLGNCCGGDCGIRSSFCDHVHFFRSHQDGRSWLRAHADGVLLEIEDAFEAGLRALDIAGLHPTDRLSAETRDRGPA